MNYSLVEPFSERKRTKTVSYSWEKLGFTRRKIRLIENNANCGYLEKLTDKGTLRQLFMCPLLGFALHFEGDVDIHCTLRGREVNQREG